MEVYLKEFSQLDIHELYQLLRLRNAIFVVEQNCVYQDLDNKDQKALHLLGKENGKIIGYARCFYPGDYFQEAAIGRIAVDSGNRGKQYGHQIVREAINALVTRCGNVPIRISAQTYLDRFYKAHGFIATGQPYLEDGLPHIAMIRKG